jgi:hypothetical protein
VAQAQLGVYATRNGTVPWRVDEQYRKLVSAFRSQVTTTILTEAFFFSHYVTDSFSVLHNTRNFDPNNGLHARWESEMLNSTANLVGIATLATSSYVGTPGRADPRHNIFDIVLVGNGLVGELIADDLAVDGGVQGLYFATRELTARRWGDALTVLSSLLWTAWAEAGSPELQGFTAGCSRAVPVGDIVLRGYPVPGGFLHPEWDGGVPGFDAGTIDAGTIDAGTVDAGTVDAGTADAGAVDAGTVDAGAIDADAGTVDAGTIDAGGGTGGGGGWRQLLLRGRHRLHWRWTGERRRCAGQPAPGAAHAARWMRDWCYSGCSPWFDARAAEHGTSRPSPGRTRPGAVPRWVRDPARRGGERAGPRGLRRRGGAGLRGRGRDERGHRHHRAGHTHAPTADARC